MTTRTVEYFKATHVDGTDFRTGTIDYAAACGTGEVIRHPSARKRRDVPSTYLSVATVETDCTGSSWPARLFRVEPVGRPMKASDLPNKRAVSALRVIEELPAHRLLGPQGEEVAAVIERCRVMTVEEAQRLTDARAERTAAWDFAWVAARDAAMDAGRCEAWCAARAAAWDAREAAWGILVRDLISAKYFDVLISSWREVMER